MHTRASLESCYRAARYVVYGPSGALDVRIGAAAFALDAELERLGVVNWALLTAHNPGSQRLPPALNEERHRQLIDWLAQAGRRYHVGENLSDQDDWPAETSVLVLDMDRAAALALAERFGQAAVVIGQRGGLAELAWCAGW